MKKYRICMLLFPHLTLQDFAGPYDVFIRADCFEVFTASENTGLMSIEGGLMLQSQYTFDTCPPFDILFVPGGTGITPLMTNKAYLSFLRSRAREVQYITAVCTGSLLLAAAGLLSGYKATTHWRSIPLLKMLNVDAVDERVVKDRNRITGGGITAGLDFGLQLTAWLGGDDMAKTIQLILEYAPQPPFNSGSVKSAAHHIIEEAMTKTQSLFEKRLKIIKGIVDAENSER
jgi:cyclohexyl-isocyanide hydratase